MKKELVSVVVVSYNSSSTIVETLESIKNQSYQNIELIITDDASKDNTIEICKEWLSKNSERFPLFKIIESDRNTGVAANGNRGYKSANGAWIKGIAGDDCLCENCITEMMSFISSHPEAQIVISDFDRYLEEMDSKHQISHKKMPSILTDNTTNHSSLLHELLCYGNNFMVAPSKIIKKTLFEKIGCYDEDFPMCEDFPMWLKITGMGEHIYYVDKSLVKYRVSRKSISNKPFDERYLDNRKRMYRRYIKNYTKRSIYYHAISDIYLKKIFAGLGLNRNSKICYVLYKICRTPLLLREYKIYWKYLGYYFYPPRPALESFYKALGIL